MHAPGPKGVVTTIPVKLRVGRMFETKSTFSSFLILSCLDTCAVLLVLKI